MTPTEVIEILTTHNSWRRGADIDLCDLPKPFVIGEAIYEAVRLLKEAETGRDFLGMPVANKSLLIPTIELKKFGEHLLNTFDIVLQPLEMGKLYTDYVKKVIKPKYEKK